MILISSELAEPTIKDEEEGNIIQICVVVKDLEKTMDNYIKILDVDSWEIYTFSPETGVQNFTWKGQEIEDFEYRIAITTINNLQFELIEPIYNVPIYQDFLEEKGEGVHHIKQKVNEESVDNVLEKFAEKDAPRMARAAFDKDFSFFLDTVEELGVIWEIGNSGAIRSPEEKYP